MYVPAHYRIDEDAARQALADFDRLATIVVNGPNGLTAGHVPLVFEDGHLRGHIARANDLARCAPCDALVICPGPEAYVSPKWYPTKRADGRAVPTWNYMVVHAAGPMTLLEDEASIRANLEALSERFERGRADRWTVAGASAEYVAALMNAIVGIDIDVRKIEAKAKLSQDKPMPDFENVIAELSKSPDPRDYAVADAMKALGR